MSFCSRTLRTGYRNPVMNFGLRRVTVEICLRNAIRTDSSANNAEQR